MMVNGFIWKCKNSQFIDPSCSSPRIHSTISSSCEYHAGRLQSASLLTGKRGQGLHNPGPAQTQPCANYLGSK